MAKRTEDWRGAIIVIFKRGTPQKRIKELVAANGCKFQNEFDGSHHVNVLVVPKGQDEAKVDVFKQLPEVESAHLNDDEGIAL